MIRHLKPLIFTAIVVAATAATTLGVAPAASASISPSATSSAYYSSTVTPGVNVRACANIGEPCRVLTTSTPTGRMQCWRDGGSATGNYTSRRWFLMELSNGQEGYVHSSFVTNQTSVAECGSLARVRAADWALSQVGAQYAPWEYRQGQYGLDWTPGPDREWSGDCAKLPWASYTRAGVSYPLNHAIGQWNALASKRGNNAYLPRYGDPVYYSIGAYGHTGIYIGGQSIVATRGSDYAKLSVEIYPLFNNGYGSYLGWAKVA